MSTLVRNPTMSYSYSRRRYEALGLHGRHTLLKSISYRRRRAKQRQVFLTTYKLEIDRQHSNSNSRSSSSRKLSKVAVKVKKIVTSVLMFMRSASFTSCNSKSAISAANTF